MHNKLSEKNKRDIVSALGLVTQLGISMAAAIFIGIFIGSFLDKTFNTSPVLLLIFTVIG
ncbi:MAG: AtpZ/AtpI family protein, partial [Clostridiales bacterium]|nr:AtpZ/AtpI family protein [Clostridiales bacterium]